MADKSVSPRRGEAFVDQNGVPLPRPMSWIEQITSLFNTNVASVTDILDDHETRIDALEPAFITIDAAESPYNIADNTYATIDMSAGDVTVVLPASGRIWLTRSGPNNVLTIQGVVNGVTNPVIVSDGDAPALAYIGSEWRYV